MTKKYFYKLDYLRGISALLIIFYHYTTRYSELYLSESNWKFAVPWGCYAVNTFFCLTGFLTFNSLSESGWKFLYKRLSRLYPCYFVSIIITSLSMAFILPERLCDLKDIILNFTMFPTYFGGNYVDGAYWTLAVEMFFYIVMAVIIKKNQEEKSNFLIIWMIITTIALIINKIDITQSGVKTLISFLMFNKRIEFFVVGSAIAIVRDKNSNKNKMIFLMIICLINAFLDLGWIYGVVWMSACMVIIWKCTLPVVEFKTSRNSAICKILTFLSSISYPLYLLHQNIGYGILNFIYKKLSLNMEICVVIPICIVMGIASLLHYLIEIPVAKCMLSTSFYKKK